VALPLGLLLLAAFLRATGSHSEENIAISRGVLRGLRWLIAAEVFALLVLASVGMIYEARSRARDRAEFPPPGRMIDVGGYRLHLQCAGEGGPTVVLDAGLVGSTLDWRAVLPEAARLTRVCAYDRGGYGWSDRSTRPRTPEGITADLHALLEKAGERPPYILVGHSLGGLNMWAFANRYPAQATGLVLVDAAHPQYSIPFPWLERAQSLFLRWILPFGLPRWRGWCGDGVSEIRSVKTAVACRAVYQQSYYEQWDAVPDYMEGARRLGTVGKLPVIVITRDPKRPGADAGREAHWSQWQQELGRISSNSRTVTAAGSGHDIPGQRPDVIVEAIREMLAELRAGRD
jgi:pimeloyl-ACP methyl ester carboxylesterase